MLLIFLFISLVSCKPDVKVLIDNPFEKDIFVSVDDHNYRVLPSSIGEVFVRPGRRVFEYDTIVQSKTIMVNYDYLINPTSRKFYVDYRRYMTSDFAKFNKNINVPRVDSDGHVIDKPSRMFKDKFIIVGSWEYVLMNIFQVLLMKVYKNIL